ncbi:MAG: GNAT family N-acetyltransferase [Myxococcales bacterium]|nr:GNAT family N-acetyltransferase [Myxococcales bacterium]
METEVRALTPALVDDWLAFFDGPAFADNPAWGTCYCRCFVFGGGGYEAWDAACERVGENREAMVERVRAGTIDGLLAYRDGAPVGWVHVGPTSRFHSPLAPLAPADEGAASIVCFVVAAGHRRTGVARTLLRAARDLLREQGFATVDARPREGGEHSDAEHFLGPLELYLSEGFSVVESSAGRARVRCSL